MDWIHRLQDFALRGIRMTTFDGISDADLLAMAEPACRVEHSVFLRSGGDHDAAHYSILATDPVLRLSWKKGLLSMDHDEGRETFDAAPMALLDTLGAGTPVMHEKCAFPLPMWVGYLAYELKNEIERLPQSALDDLDLPDLLLYLPSRLRVHDRRLSRLVDLHLDFGHSPLKSSPPPATFTVPPQLGAYHSSLPQSRYVEAVARARNHIVAGDIYQVNLAQRLCFSLTGDPWTLWRGLSELHPGPFHAWIHAGDHTILSTSMERFVTRRGSRIETRPIKGTRRRSSNPTEDARIRADLASHPKDAAELAMIVDLMRNDLSRVCEPGSVRVLDPGRVETTTTLHHRVAVVEGRVREGTGTGSVLRATFPGGSITGCPKIRAMEIIDTIEPVCRHVYTGSIGWMASGGDLDLSIAIRTMILKGDALHFGLGAGIVYDSDPESEYRETLDKGAFLASYGRFP